MIKNPRASSSDHDSSSLLGALCPSKSGLMNKHIVKHIVFHGMLSLDSLGSRRGVIGVDVDS